MGRLTDDMRRLRGDIDSSRSSRLAQTNEMQNNVKAQLADFASARIKNGQQDSQARANFVSDMSKATSNLISDFNADRRSMAEQTSKQRADFITNLSNGVSAFINDIATDRADAHAVFFGTVSKKKTV